MPKLTGPEFVRLMERYGIKPKDLGITSAYKCQLKHGLREPSKELVEKLLKLIEEKKEGEGGGTPTWEGCGASRTPLPSQRGQLNFRDLTSPGVSWPLWSGPPRVP